MIAQKTTKELRQKYSDMDPTLLMQQIAGGDQDACTFLYERERPFAIHVIARKGVHKRDVEDIFQEAMIRVFETADRYNSKLSKLNTWVNMIMRRTAIDHVRRRDGQAKKPRPSFIFSNEVLKGIGASDKTSEEQTESQKGILFLHYFRGQTLATISESLGIPMGTVKSSLSRGLNYLREQKGLPEAFPEWAEHATKITPSPGNEQHTPQPAPEMVA